MTVSQMVRAALFVTDLERSEKFYREVLGLNEVYFQGDLAHPAAAQLLGMPADVKTRALILKAEGPAYGMVGLFELIDPVPPKLNRSQNGANVGELCMVFYCPNVDPVVEKATQFGGEIVCAPVFLKVGNRGGQREMVLRDPDGAMINVIEWDFNSEGRRPEEELD